MRNIKRILAMSLATVMLCASMVVGSAASFNDADKIVNTEAVTVTTGLGIFAGTTNGNFNPTGTTTRAQMAAVIVKMLYGADINADQFKGTSKFSDVADFEGGWAEGYINLCSSKGIIAGYGDGTFKPGAAVTTAEATTMIINALGVDAGEGTWPLTVMAKAEEMKLFAELAVKPGTNEALTRDTLASVVFEAIKYSPKGTTGYKVTGVPYAFDSFSDALSAVFMSDTLNITDITEVVGEDALASTIFNMVSVSGFVADNQATGYDYTEVNGVALNLVTDLDMIGHYVTAYYAEEYENEDKPGIAYAIVDEAKYVVITGDEAIDTKKEYQSLFGTKKVPTATEVYTIDGNYASSIKSNIDGYDQENYTAPNGTYVIYDGQIIAFIQGATKTLTKVVRVTTTPGKESILVSGIPAMQNNEDKDVVNAYEGIAKDDYVVVTEANGIYTLTKANKVEGKITRTAVINGIKTITVNGIQYKAHDADNNTGLAMDVSKISWEETYAVYIADGKYIGWNGVTAAANIADVVYIVGTYTVDATTDAYGKVTTNTYAQGVDMNGKEVSYLIATKDTKEVLGNVTLTAGYYTFKLSTVSSDEKKAGIMTAFAVTKDTEETVFITDLNDTNRNETVDSKTAYVDVDSDIAFIESTTKFIVVDDATLGGEMDIAIVTGSYSGNVAARPAIVSKDAAGNITLEVVVIYDEVSFKADDYIYVSEDMANVKSTTANGDQYTVYFVNDAVNKEIIVDNASLIKGFYEYSFETVDGAVVYTLEPVIDAEDDFILTNEIFTRLSGTKLISTTIKALDATNVKIVDARTEETLKNADISEIIALEDMQAAVDAGYEITFSAMLNEDLEDATAITLIIITDIKEATNPS